MNTRKTSHLRKGLKVAVAATVAALATAGVAYAMDFTASCTGSKHNITDGAQAFFSTEQAAQAWCSNHRGPGHDCFVTKG
jgi:hypothetical protein